MSRDPIVDEVRRARETESAKHGFDVKAILSAAKKRQRRSGQIADDEPYEVEVTPDLRRWRRNVDFLPCTETPIRPLIADLEFIENKRHGATGFVSGRSASTTTTST